MGKKEGLNVVILICAFAFGIMFFAGAVNVIALAYGNASNANLTIWTGGTASTQNLTLGNYPGKIVSDWNFIFYANFTNITGSVMNASQGAALCQIRINDTTGFNSLTNATYNSTSLLWQYISNVTNRGNLTFNFYCNSTYGNVTLNDNFTVRNTPPAINKSFGSMITLMCTEDTLCPFNLTGNVTEDDINDRPNLVFSASANTTLTNYTLSSGGMLVINKTTSVDAVNQNLIFTVTDQGLGSDIANLPVSVSSVNDAPIWANLTNQSLNITFAFNYQIQAVDEENNTPLKLNLTFISCATAQWSSRNSTNCTLFNSSQYSFNNITGVLNISFNPSRDDVGEYTINFTVTDSGSINPANATTTTVVNFSINNINLAPYFRYLCDNERSTTQGTAFSCLINATDVDETSSLTLRSTIVSSNTTTTWFTFNTTAGSASVITIPVNITTQFNGSAFVNFTPNNLQVGNWSINITVNDSTSPTRTNSSVFYFFVSNIPDGTYLQNLTTLNVFTSNNYTIYIDGYDDDLLIPDKNVFNENLNFFSNDSRVFIQKVNSTSNKSTARIVFNGSNFTSSIYYVNLTVNDSGNLHTNSTLLILNFSTNTPPSWNSSLIINYTLMEDVPFALNLTGNVSDAENDVITFSYSNDSVFPGFVLDTNTGVISFTPVDGDVGTHRIVINASDGKTPTPLNFTFTVYNLNESPYILRPFTTGNNITINSTNSNINATEDSRANFVILVEDEDFKVPSGQKSYHNESLSINLTIVGPNINLFNLTFNSLVTSNRSQYDVVFIPNKSDAGNYNITLNITDISNKSDLIVFNLSIAAINHIPNLTAISNKTSYLNATFSLDLNATDIEDGSDNGNLTYNITFLQGVNFIGGNDTIFNITTGLLNLTFNDTHPGIYHLNVTVNDSTQMKTSRDFFITVYGIPQILTSVGQVFNLTEQNETNLTFVVNHSVQDNLTYYFYYEGSLKYNITTYANGSSVNWTFTPTLSDETYGNFKNITLLVVNPTYNRLNASRNWSINISHTNAPVLLNGSIPNYQKNFGQEVVIPLGDYFRDLDSNDTAYNQTLNFTVLSNVTNSSAISIRVTNGSLNIESSLPNVTFNAGGEAFEAFNITANDSAYANISNFFTIQFTMPTVTSTPSSSSSSGGGGGASQVKPVSLNLIVPGPITARKQDKLIIPIGVVNDGRVPLSGIVLRNLIAKNGLLRSDLLASFDRSFITELLPGQRENLTLIVDVDTKDPGLYEITLNGTSTEPVYSDTAKLFVNVEEGDTVTERISFTQEFIAQNPQCIEIKELVDEARALYIAGDTQAAEDKTDQALQACQNAIAQTARVQQRAAVWENLTGNVGIATIAALVLGIGYYWFRRIRMQSVITEGKV